MRTLPVLLTSAALAATVTACGASRPPAASPPPRTHGVLSAATVAPPATAPPTATVTVTGTGTVSGQPNEATVALGVQATAPHAAAALAQANAATVAVEAVLARHGVAASDITTQNLSLYTTTSPPAYQAGQSLSVTLHDLTQAGQIVDQVVGAAGDTAQLQGVTFAVSDTSPLRTAARQAAVADARREATDLAAAAGETLGALRSVTDQPSAPTYPSYASGASAAGPAGAAVPLSPGVQQLSEQVTAVWNLLPG